MTREEFEVEFQALKASVEKQLHSTTWENRSKDVSWHRAMESNLHRLSDEALRFIIANANEPFGKWLVDKAIYLTAFEDVVLRGDDGDQG